MADKDLIACGEEHEMKTILRSYKKRQTAENVAMLAEACKKFKASSRFTPKNRAQFLRYIETYTLLERLE